MDPRQSLLLAWADLAAAALPSVPLVAAPREDFLWLGPSGGLFTQGLARSCDLPNSAMARRLAQLDALAPESHVLREGWVFLAGTIERDGSAQPIVLPLLSRSVRLATNAVARTVARQIVTGGPVLSGPPEFRLTADGEAEITELVEDPSVRGDLGDRAEFGRDHGGPVHGLQRELLDLPAGRRDQELAKGDRTAAQHDHLAAARLRSRRGADHLFLGSGRHRRSRLRTAATH